MVHLHPQALRKVECSEIGESIISDKVIVRDSEQEVLVAAIAGLFLVGVDGQEGKPFPLLVQQAWVLGAAVMEAEFAELGVDVEVNEGAV